MSTSDFASISCNFKSEFDPKTKAAIEKKWSNEDFKEFASSDDSLFKLCAKAVIDKDGTSSSKKIKLSTQY
jgi:hypothetical protein